MRSEQHHARSSRLFHSIYLHEREVKSLAQYKYVGVNSNILVAYCLGPFWRRMVKILPRWVHPNILTIFGFFTVLIACCATELYARHVGPLPILSNPSTNPLFYIAIGVLIALYHHSDGMDGCQARRLGLSSPIGELLDHGIDSWIFGMILYIISRLINYQHYTYRLSIISIAVFLTHWEKQYTNVFVLDCALDSTLLFVSSLLTILYFFPMLFEDQFTLATSVLACEVLINLLILIFVYHSWSRVLHALRRKYSGQLLVYNFLCTFVKFLPIIGTNLMFILWDIASPNKISKLYPFTFAWCHFTLLSHLICHTIIESMTGISSTCNNKHSSSLSTGSNGSVGQEGESNQ
ncbi:MAG: Phosphotransferase [Marteilia pararefringens]